MPQEPFHPSFIGLIRLPPKPRFLVGSVILAGGIFLTVFLWNHGVIASLSIFAVVTGLLMTFSGLAGMRALSKRRQMVVALKERKEEILEALIEAKRQGKNPVRLLNDQGILDPEVRAWFLEELRQRRDP